MRDLSEITAEIEKRSDARMRKRKSAAAPLILAAALIVCVALSAVFVMSIKADEATEKELIKDVIYHAEIVTMKASSIPDDVIARAKEARPDNFVTPEDSTATQSGPSELDLDIAKTDAAMSDETAPEEKGFIPSQLSDVEKKYLIDSYIDALKGIYTTSASQLYTYSDIRRQLMNSDDEYYDRVYDHGVFEVVVNSSKIRGNTATVNATVYSWQKYIISGEGPWFAVSFPVARTTCDYELEKVNGVWMIASQTETDYVFDADGSLMKTFDNYVDAAEYAKSVTVDNLFAGSKRP